jgi:hypothetical protein
MREGNQGDMGNVSGDGVGFFSGRAEGGHLHILITARVSAGGAQAAAAGEGESSPARAN